MKSYAKQNSVRFALFLSVFTALGPFTFDMYLPSFPNIMAFYETSASAVQLSLTACLLGVGVGQIFMGALSDVHGRRKPLFIAMIVYALVSFGCAFAPNITVLIALRFIQGFAASAGMVIARAIVRDLFSGVELTKFFSVLTMIGNAAPLLAPIAGSIVLTYSSWVGVFIFLGFLGIYLVIISTWKIKESLPVEKRIPSNVANLFGTFKTLIKNRVFMGYALTQGMLMAGIFSYISGASFIYQNIYHLAPQVFALLFAVNGIALILGATTVRRLAGKVPERSILIIGLGLAVIACTTLLLVVVLEWPVYMFIMSLFFFVGSTGLVSPVTFMLAMESQGHIAGSAASILGVTPFLLGSIASPFVGIAGENSALPFGIIIFVSCLLAVGAYVFLVERGQKAVL